MGGRASEGNVNSLERALIILEVLGQSSDGLGVTQIGEKTGLHKSTVYRLLHTMGTRGFVEQDPYTERYKLGIKIAELGLNMLDNLDLRREALPFLEELVEISREAVLLAVLDGNEVVVLERKVHPGEMVTLNLGLRMPVHCTATGKVLLSGLSQSEIEKVLSGKHLTRYTINTITDLNQLSSYLERVRTQGYATSAEEQAEGVRSVAAPVLDHRNRVIAAVGITGPSSRLSLERLSRLITVLKETCHSISTQMGHGISSWRK